MPCYATAGHFSAHCTGTVFRGRDVSLIAVVPISLFALTIGCQKHRDLRTLALGVTGLTILVLSALLGHEVIGEAGEKIATTFGASLIAAGHLLNHKLCQKLNCECDFDVTACDSRD